MITVCLTFVLLYVMYIAVFKFLFGTNFEKQPFLNAPVLRPIWELNLAHLDVKSTESSTLTTELTVFQCPNLITKYN